MRLGRLVFAAVFLTAAGAVAAPVLSDAESRHATQMNRVATAPTYRCPVEGGVRVLFIGNSITVHPVLPRVGWTNFWGMAASAKEKDYVHLVTAGIERETGRKADLLVRNLAAFEEKFATYDLGLVDDLVAFNPDYLVVALGENVPVLATDGDKTAYRAAFKRLLSLFVGGGRRPKAVVRGSFWPNPERDALMFGAAAELGIPFVAAARTDESWEAHGLFADEGVAYHPCDKGMAELAKIILAKLFPESQERLSALVESDVSRPVRPVGVDGQESCWNVNSTWFMYPPSFAFPRTKGADGYCVRIVDSSGKVRYSEQTNAVVSLEKDWSVLPPGRTEVWCDAYRRHPHWTVGRNFRVFWKMEPYRPGSYPKAPRSYLEAAKLCSTYLLEMPWLRTYAETGKPDPSYGLNCYPAKMDSAVMRLMVAVARLMPERREAALRLAHAAARHLLALSQPDGAPLAGFPPTYVGTANTADQYKGMNMLVYPAEAGTAYLALHALTKEKEYLAAARRIGETYLKLQGADGTWYLKMLEKTGAPVTGNRLHPGSVIGFLDELFAATGDDRFRAAADRAFGFYEKGPLRDWNWEGQFEDVEPSGKYENLTKHPACSLAIRIAHRWPTDERRLVLARELLRFAEDQFVVWSRPKGPDADSLLALLGSGWDVEPAVVEQYFYREAVDASAAKMINAYLALYEVTGNPLDLAKARTLGDAIVRIQKPNGRIQTLWTTACGKDLQSDWVNCMAASVKALVNLSRFDNK